MKRRFPALVLCLLLICSVFIPISLGGNVKNIPHQPVSSNSGNTLYVGGSGGDNYTKIQDAIDIANDGDIIFVYNNSSPYKELLTINKSIQLIGENRDNTIIDGNNIGSDVVTISADSVDIRSFTIQGSGGDTHHRYHGIRVNSNYCSVFGNIVKNNYRGLISYSTENISIHNNIFNDNKDASIVIDNSINNNIEKNTIFDYGIILYDCDKNNIINNTIINAWIHLMYRTEENIIIGNTVTDPVGSALRIGDNSIGNIITDNHLSNSIWGISIIGNNFPDDRIPTNNILQNNTIINNQIGIELELCEKNLIENNIVSNNNQGINFVMNGLARENTISQNIISNNEYGIKFDSQSYNPSYKNEITRNNLIDNEINAYDSLSLGGLIFGNNNYWDNNYYSNYKGGFIHFIPSRLSLFVFSIPFFTIDWNPAQEPFDIEV